MDIDRVSTVDGGRGVVDCGPRTWTREQPKSGVGDFTGRVFYWSTASGLKQPVKVKIEEGYSRTIEASPDGVRLRRLLNPGC